MALAYAYLLFAVLLEILISHLGEEPLVANCFEIATHLYHGACDYLAVGHDPLRKLRRSVLTFS